jgi:predicted membrane chloride channel (bestrophin family)
LVNSWHEDTGYGHPRHDALGVDASAGPHRRADLVDLSAGAGGRRFRPLDSRQATRRAARACGDSPDATDLTQRIGLWTIAFAYASKNSLKGTKTLGPTSQLLPPEEVQAALNSAHPPSTVGKNITLGLVEARDRGLISDYVMIAIDDNVRKMVDDIGGCERIRSTPLPFVYVVHLRRALIAYCFTLPMALVSFYGWWTILVTFMISYTFFGIEEIGVEIEDPFGHGANDLPLEVFCELIDREVTCLLEMETQPRAIPR